MSNRYRVDRNGDRIYYPSDTIPNIHNEDVPVYDPIAELKKSLKDTNIERNPVLQKRLFKSEAYSELASRNNLPKSLAMKVEGHPFGSKREKERWLGRPKKNGSGGKYVFGSAEDDARDWKDLGHHIDHLQSVAEERDHFRKYSKRTNRKRY